MFSSPSLRLQNHENSEGGLVARKPGLSHSVSRKAFQDRDVNKKPLQQKPLKTNVNIFKDTKQSEPKIKTSPDWLLETCSFKDVKDNYEDILPSKDRLSKRDIFHSLKAFQKTKKRKEKIVVDVEPVELDPMVFEVPAVNELVFNCVELEDDISLPEVEGFD